MASNGKKGRRYRISGLVQGVGFRPTVWRLAWQCGLTGHVLNDAAGVEIEAFGSAEALARFEALIVGEAPPLSRIDKIVAEDITPDLSVADFSIHDSKAGSISTGIVPDAATCLACLEDVLSKDNRRHGYAFANCTHCGPRLSIVRGIPYDRANTSMSVFPMCDDCRTEYEDPADRRFHAQPNACPVCGPRVWFEDADGGIVKENALKVVAEWFRDGKIIAIKGIGGFHLACDATSETAVSTLRLRKRRAAKPLAVMVRDMEIAHSLAAISEKEAFFMTSSTAPVVLVVAKPESSLASSIAPGQARIGMMLPYSPLHALLMAKLDFPLVMTSGNRSSEPQATDNDDARKRLSDIADGWLMHDREIVNRLDDSVIRGDKSAVQIIRRARGFAPEPLLTHEGASSHKRILAMGGELKSTFCLLENGRATLSQHIGDLEEATAFADYRRNLDLYRRLFDFTPDAIAVDQHPDYLSTQYGRELGKALGIPVVPVQHHHAHFAACLAENGLPPDEKALGLVLDGLGLGYDGTIWGAEILLGDCRGFQRLAHFHPVAMPGGAAASREPWRNLVAHLRAAFGPNWHEHASTKGLLQNIDPAKIDIANQMIERGVNSPLASSAGRLFDALAAALGICPARQDFEGQTGMELEALALPNLHHATPYPSERQIVDGRAVLSWQPLWQSVLEDISAGMERGVISARFHLGLVRALIDTLLPLAGQTGVKRVALSGGVINNSILFDGLCEGLADAGLTPVVHRKLPANDGGISLGQAVIAASRIDDL